MLEWKKNVGGLGMAASERKKNGGKKMGEYENYG
jgi:hypothetical protein